MFKSSIVTFIHHAPGLSSWTTQVLSPLRLAYRCSSTQPKITTHYSIVPRESDERWKSKLAAYFISIPQITILLFRL